MTRKVLVFATCVLLAGLALALDMPYDENADANAELRQALVRAQDSSKKVLLIFGANWCKDCRELDKALHGKSAPMIDSKFIVVKIDVGNFDKNLDLAKSYGNPIRKGIPAAVMLTSDNRMLYATRAGELADARRMGEDGIRDFFSRAITAHQ